MVYKMRILLPGLLLLSSLLTACQLVEASPSTPTAAYPADVATRWFELQLTLIKETPGFTPPVASRALGYSGVTLYEAVVGGMPANNSLAGQLNGLTMLPQPESNIEYHWPAAANSALSTILRRLYPTATPDNLAAIDALEHQYATQFKGQVNTAVFNRSTEFGQNLAEEVFEWSKSDGGYEGYTRNFPTDFSPPIGVGYWIPTPPGYQAALQPYWGQNRPFVIQSGEECAPLPPAEYAEDPSSQFYAEAMEVYTAVLNLTAEQEAIALFWADDPGTTFTPPGHSISIATQVLQVEDADLAIAAETYAGVGMAVADAFVGCWHSKYVHNLIRPISYIQSMIDPAWNTPDITDPVITPPFPEYPSGHSTQSGAAAAVLTARFGEDYHFIDRTQVAAGLPARAYGSFAEAADEAAISRLYGGIHFRPAIELGIEQGRCIGEQVNALDWRN